MLKVYGIPNCNTVKKALDVLKEHNVDFDFHNYKKLGISEAKIDEWINQISLESLINKKGTTYRGLSDDEKSKLENKSTALGTMIEKPSMIKRPIFERANGSITINVTEVI